MKWQKKYRMTLSEGVETRNNDGTLYIKNTIVRLR